MSLWLPDDEEFVGHPELLQTALDRYRRVLGGGGYAFWEWGLHDDSYRCGGSFWAKLGYESVDESVTNVDNVQEYIHPDDFKLLTEVVLNHLRYDTPIDLVYRLKAKDGSYWWTQACASSTRGEDGRVTYLSGVNFDLSHLKETEKALRLSEARHERILAASNDGIWEWSIGDEDKAARIHTSYSCWRHLGYSEKEVEKFRGKQQRIWCDHIDRRDLQKVLRALYQHFRKKVPFDMEYRMLSKNQELFWIRSRGQAVFTPQGEAILMSGINIDITELKKAQAKVNRAKEDAERASKAKSHFLSRVSHELRTPLNAILGFAEASATRALDIQQYQNYNAQIYSAGQHLLQLINDILDLSQVAVDKISLQMEPVKALGVVQEAHKLVEPLAQQHGVRLYLHINGLESVTVMADKLRLRQCLLNVLHNAIKYNCVKGEVHIILYDCAKALYIQIEDTGQGICEEKRGELFKVFSRLGAEHTEVEGSGVGLAFAKELMEKMQGDLYLSDNKKMACGACFVLSLPKTELQEEVEVRPLAQIELPKLNTKKIKRIIYIEDNVANIYLLQELLSPYEQIALTCYSDPLIGLYHVRKDPPDILILDINLPKVSGFDVAELLSKDKVLAQVPLVALSASAQEKEQVQGVCQNRGFDFYLTKPLSLLELVAAFNKVWS